MRIDAATSSITTAVCIPPSSMAVRRCVRSNSRYHNPTMIAASTASPAASVAVTRPENMPPRMMMGIRNVGIASTNAWRSRVQRKRFFDGKIVALGEPPRDGHQAEPSEDTGYEPGNEQLFHGSAGGNRVEDHRDRRRDDDRERRRRGVDRSRERRRVALTLHFRNQDRPERRDICDGAAGDLRKDHRHSDRDHRQSAAHETDQRRDERRSASVMPPAFMMAPASTNIGMAISENEVEPRYISIATDTKPDGPSLIRIPATDATAERHRNRYIDEGEAEQHRTMTKISMISVTLSRRGAS